MDAIRDSWRIDDLWWRAAEEPVSRLYFELLLANGRLTTVFFDLIGQAWYEQAGARGQ